MWKAISRLLLGRGKLPEPVRHALAAETIDVLVEGVRGTITYRNYRAPGRRSNWRRTWFAGALALTGRRVVAYRGRERLLDIPFDHPIMRAVRIVLEQPERLYIAYDAAAFHTDRSGIVELRFFTDQAATLAARIEQRIR